MVHKYFRSKLVKTKIRNLQHLIQSSSQKFIYCKVLELTKLNCWERILKVTTFIATVNDVIVWFK